MRRTKIILIVAFSLCGNYVFPQEIITAISKSVESFSAFDYQEKVFLHTDKTVYVAGEVLWFKSYITEANTGRLSELSKICYVEIIGDDKRQVVDGKIEITRGTGNGSFLIPPSVRTGNYLLRSYTNWMKNFSPALYFEKVVTIINPAKKAGQIKTRDDNSYRVQFFPEGGNLVAGLKTRVAFRMIDSYGRPVHGTGILRNENDDSVIVFSADKSGVGSFPFVANQASTYHAVVKINDTLFRQELPKIYPAGWTMGLTDEGDILRVTVYSNVPSQQAAYLFVQTRDSLRLAKSQFLKNDSTEFTIDKSVFGEGVSRLTVFNESKQPVCERLYFKSPKMLGVTLTGVKSEFRQREKVEIDVTVVHPGTDTASVDMSVSVCLVDSLQPPDNLDILNYLWVVSDVTSPVQSPEIFTEPSNISAPELADYFMLTKGWSRNSWGEILSNNKPSFTFLPERDGHSITGKILAPGGQVAKPGTPVYLSVAGRSFKFANDIAGSDGHLQFNVEKFYGKHDLIVQPSLEDSNYRISIDRPFSENFSETRVNPIALDTNLAQEILIRATGVQTATTYHPQTIERYSLPASYDTTAFFGNPSKTYFLDDYTRFPAMEEVMREYIKEVRVRKRQQQFHYEVYNELNKLYFDSEPLVLLDGVPVFNINKIMEMDPLAIKQIDVSTVNIYRGTEEYPGIVSYTTYVDDIRGYQLDPAAIVIDYEGLQFEREFYSPMFDSLQAHSRLPDYRNVLYWSPDVKTKEGKHKLTFYTSDVPGTYRISVQGISASGLPGAGYFYITVK